MSVGHERADYGPGQVHRDFRLMGDALLDVLGPAYGVFLVPNYAGVPVGQQQQQSHYRMAPVEVREVVVGVDNKLT